MKTPRFLRHFLRRFHKKLPAAIVLAQAGNVKQLESILFYPNQGDMLLYPVFYIEDLELAAVAAAGMFRPGIRPPKLDLPVVAKHVMKLIRETHTVKTWAWMHVGLLYPDANNYEVEARVDERMVVPRIFLTNALINLALQPLDSPLKEEVKEVIERERRGILTDKRVDKLRQSEPFGPLLEAVFKGWE
jgi:hypothetical protein